MTRDTDRRSTTPRLVDREAALEAAREALWLGAALAAEREQAELAWEREKASNRYDD